MTCIVKAVDRAISGAETAFIIGPTRIRRPSAGRAAYWVRLMSSQATFEPVSAKTQPVSGHTTCQIPDIENSCSRDSSRKTPPRWEAADFPRQRPAHCPLPANPWECRRFSHTWKSHRRDRTGWLGREDSNLGIAGVAHMLTATTTTAHSQAHCALAPDLVAAPRQNNRHLPRP
jgi:hypothetical protein